METPIPPEGIKQVCIYQKNERMPMQIFVHDYTAALLAEHFTLATKHSVDFAMVQDIT